MSSTRPSTIQVQHYTLLPVQWGMEVLALGTLYYLTAWLGLRFAIPPGNASAVWPPSGVALAALILRSRTIFPGIWLGAFAASTSTDISMLVAAALATGNTVAAVLAASLYKTFFDRNRLSVAPKEAFLWLSIATVPGCLAATCGTTCLYLAAYIDSAQFSVTWLTWCLGDLTGVMTITPVLISFADRNIASMRQPRRRLELLVAFLVLCVMCQALFGGWLPINRSQGLLYLPMVVFLWLTLRFEPRAVLTGNLLIAAVAVSGTSSNLGAFATETASQSFFDLQLFINVLTFTVIMMIAVVTKGRDSESHRRVLDQEVREKNAQFEVAIEIQRSLFPSGSLRGRNYECAGSWQPADKATGDYFDFVTQADGSVVILIADVSGHGIGPALLMAETRAYSRALLLSSSSLEEKVRQLNSFLYDDLDVDRFVTLAICRFDPEHQIIEFIGAGHDGTLLRQGGQVERLETSTPPLGILRQLPDFQTSRVPLNVGDSVFLCTDGFIEARSANGTLFGREQLVDLLAANRELAPEELLRLLASRVAEFSGGALPADDQTAVTLTVH